MLPLSIKMHLLTFLFIFVLSGAYGQDRKITSQLNPGCTKCTGNETLVYIKAVGPHDCEHQIWDFTRGVPTFIFAIGHVNSNLTINWDENATFNFKFNQEPDYSFATVIDKLVEFNDIPDIGEFNSSLPRTEYGLEHLNWQRHSLNVGNGLQASVDMKAHFRNKGLIEVKLTYLPFTDYAPQLPHLIHTANSTLADVSLTNLTARREYNSSRFALSLLFASTDGATNDMEYDMRKSLDDEHTPGVFEIVEIKTPSSARSGAGGFLQFRPVGYTQPERGVTTSTLAHVSQFNRTRLPESSTVEQYFHQYEAHQLLQQAVVVSFGESSDGFYRQHNYTAWSFTVGYGSPPLEGFSTFVIAVISVGLIVPTALALSGVIYVIVRRRRASNLHTRLNDVD